MFNIFFCSISQEKIGFPYIHSMSLSYYNEKRMSKCITFNITETMFSIKWMCIRPMKSVQESFTDERNKIIILCHWMLKKWDSNSIFFVGGPEISWISQILHVQIISKIYSTSNRSCLVGNSGERTSDLRLVLEAEIGKL